MEPDALTNAHSQNRQPMEMAILVLLDHQGGRERI